MPQILVWQCDTTKKIFVEEAEYKKHLRSLAIKNRQIKKDNLIKNTFARWLKEEQTKVESVEHIAAWLLENQRTIMDAASIIPSRHNSFGDKFFDTDIFTEIYITDIRWNPNLSNSHSCPIGGVENWGGKGFFADGKPKPTGYPGWHCNVRGKLQRLKKHNSAYPGGMLFNYTNINTGTGGGGNESFVWDAKIWAADWPGPASKVMLDKLRGNNPVAILP